MDPEISQLLEDNTTSRFYVEYREYLSNHVSQGLYALGQIKAPIKDAEDFVDWMKKEKLEDSNLHRQRETREEKQPENPNQVLGARTSYYYLLEYYRQLLDKKYKGSVEQLVNGEFPNLAYGVVGSALHGLIQLGYGCASKRAWFICEGLAYTHYSYLPQQLSDSAPDIKQLGSGSKDILEVFQMIKDDTELTQHLEKMSRSEEYMSLELDKFTCRVKVLFDTTADQIAKYVHMIKFPLNLQELTLDKVDELSKWIVDMAVIVYAISEVSNDFFLLHGVTSAWAFRNVLLMMTHMKNIQDAIRAYLSSLIAVYLTQSYPALNTKLLEDNDGLSYPWDDLVQQALLSQDKDREHMYKIVQVCRDLSEVNNTPQMESLYRLACHKCLTEPFVYYPY